MTRRGDVHEAGSLRVRFPNAERDMLEAVLVNTAGGTAGGDRFSVSLHARENARLQLTTAAAEKIYRSHGPAARIVVELRADATCAISPGCHRKPSCSTKRACRARSRSISPTTATLALCEIVVFGRAAMGERMRARAISRPLATAPRRQARFSPKMSRSTATSPKRSTAAAVAKGGAAVGDLVARPWQRGQRDTHARGCLRRRSRLSPPGTDLRWGAFVRRMPPRCAPTSSRRWRWRRCLYPASGSTSIHASRVCSSPRAKKTSC